MNSGEFILEVPAELRMRKNLRRYREIMFAKAMSSAIHEILQNVAACRQYFVTFMDDRANARGFENALHFQTHKHCVTIGI